MFKALWAVVFLTAPILAFNQSNPFFANAIKNGNLPYEGIVVIDFDELQNITSHVLHYPNKYYASGYCPIKISDDKSEAYYKAYELQQLELHKLYVKELEVYLWQNNLKQSTTLVK